MARQKTERHPTWLSTALFRGALVIALVTATITAFPLANWRHPAGSLVAVSPDGKVVASTYLVDPSDRPWNDTSVILDVRKVKTGESLLCLELEATVESLALSSTSLLAAGQRSGSIRVWNLDTAEETLAINTKAWNEWGWGGIYRLNFLPNNETLVATTGASVLLIDVTTGERIVELPRGQVHYASTVLLDDQIAVNVVDTRCRTVETELYRCASDRFERLASPFKIRSSQWNGYGITLARSPDGQLLASSDEWGIEVWSLDEQVSDDVRLPPLSTVNALKFSPDSGTLAVAGDADWVALHDWAKRETTRLKTPAGGTVRDLDYFPDGRRLVTIGDDATTRIWDVQSGDLLASYASHWSQVKTMWGLLAGFCVWSFLWIWSGRRWRSVAVPSGDVLSLCGVVCILLIVRLHEIGDLHDFTRPPYAVLFAILGNMICLPAMWMTLVGVRWSLRIPIALLGLTLVWMAPFFVMRDPGPIHIAAVGSAMGLGFLLLVVSLIRRLGFQLVVRREAQFEVQSYPATDQMPLRDLIRCVVAIGILFGVARFLSPQLQSPSIYLIAAAISCLAVIVAITGVFSCLGRLPWLFVPLAFGFACLTSAAPTLLQGLAWTIPPIWFTWLSISLSLTTILSAAVFRIHGFRVIWQASA